VESTEVHFTQLIWTSVKHLLSIKIMLEKV